MTRSRVLISGAVLTVVCLLLVVGYSWRVREYNRRCELIFAIERGDAERARQLIVAGADINQQDRNGRTPLHVAIEANQPEVFDLLLQHKARMDMHDKDGSSVVHDAVMVADVTWLQKLLQHGANPNEPNLGNRFSPNSTPIFYALSYENTPAVTELVNAGADVNHVNDEGKIPLFIAVAKKLFRAMIVMINAGGDPSVRWGKNKTQRPIVDLWKGYSGGDNGKHASNPDDQQAYAELVQLLKEKGYLKEDIE